jgi:trimeric autotransporter adhesin
MVLKLPPPPQLPVSFGGFGQQLNRWLLEIQSILNSQGTIDPSQVDGLPALFMQVATNTTEIAANTAAIAVNTASIATNTAAIATNTANIATLTARNQILNGAGAPAVGLGNNGDLYINNTGAPGTYIYGKIAGAWVAFA